MTDTPRSKPANYGFDLNFDDLANVKPMGVKPKAPAADVKSVQTKPKSKKPKADLATVKPKPPKLSDLAHKKAGPIKAPAKSAVRKAQARAEAAASDAVAKSLGFQTRQAETTVLKKRRRTHHDEPVDQLSIRGPVRVLNQFIDHCDQHNLSYWEALEQLLAQNA